MAFFIYHKLIWAWGSSHSVLFLRVSVPHGTFQASEPERVTSGSTFVTCKSRPRLNHPVWPTLQVWLMRLLPISQRSSDSSTMDLQLLRGYADISIVRLMACRQGVFNTGHIDVAGGAIGRKSNCLHIISGFQCFGCRIRKRFSGAP